MRSIVIHCFYSHQHAGELGYVAIYRSSTGQEFRVTQVLDSPVEFYGWLDAVYLGSASRFVRQEIIDPVVYFQHLQDHYEFRTSRRV